jgi:hypothetical protein
VSTLARRALLLAAALACTACADALLAPEGQGRSCIDDDECTSGTVCVIGVCLDPTAQALDEVLLEVRPPDGSGYQPQQLQSPVSIGSAGRQAIALQPTVMVRGNVVGTSMSPVPSRVVAVPTSGIPGRALVVNAAADGSMGDFALPVVEGSTYTLTFFPDDTSRPPHFYPSTLTIGAGAVSQLAAIELPDAVDLVRVSGRVVAGEGTAMLGVEGLEVRLLEGERRVSSIARTQADGSFAVDLAPGRDTDLTLEVRPTEANRLNPVVRMEALSFEGPYDVGDIQLGALSAPVPFAGTVNGPDGDPVARAIIYLRATLGAGEFTLLVNADDEGRYDAELRPGEYELAAVAPTDDPSAGMLSGFVTEVGPEVTPLINLRSRVSASGQVLDDGGVPVGNAQVLLTRIGHEGGAEDPVLEGAAWTFTAVTDDGGGWQHAVDPGRYRIVVVPDASSSLPRLTRVVDVGEGNGTIGTLELSPPAVIAGTITGANGESIGAAAVNAFSPFPVEDEAALELGSALTDTEGSFEIVLPDLAAD